MTINVYTPEEARERLCCNINTSTELCVANDCMAWRWQPLMTDEPGFLEAVKKVMEEHNLTHGKARIVCRSTRSVGFCGLAGSWRTS